MRHLILGLALVLAIAGCKGGSTGNESEVSATTSDSTTITSASTTPTSDSSDPGFPLVYPGPPLTISILTEGILHIDPESRCVTLESSGNVSVVAVPEGATIGVSEEGDPTLVMEGCRPMGDGERVQFGGVGSNSDEKAVEQYVDAAYLDRCGATTEKLVLMGHC